MSEDPHVDEEKVILPPLKVAVTPKEKRAEPIVKSVNTYKFPIDQRPESDGSSILPTAKVK
jgi:hypothetical protein